MHKSFLCLTILAFSVQSPFASRLATKRVLSHIGDGDDASTTLPMDGVDSLKNAIDSLSGGSQAGEDAKEVLDTLFGGLNDAGLVAESTFDDATKVVVTLKGDVLGELATKSKVPYEVQLDHTMSAEVVPKGDGAIELKMEGLFFAPPADAKPLFEQVLAFKETAAANKKMCKTECASDDDVDCESCVAYEWYREHRDEVAAQDGKMARILTATPFRTEALGWEKQQGNWTPSRVGDKNRRRIIYSMLLAAPAKFERFIFGSQPADFGAPDAAANRKGKAEQTYDKDSRYMAVISVEDFHGNDELQAFFAAHRLAYKSLEIGKASLIGKYGTTYDYPLDMAEKFGQGTSGINFARMVSAANPVLHAQNIFVRPAKPDKVMKMLGLCEEALGDAGKINTGCSGSDGRILWKQVAQRKK